MVESLEVGDVVWIQLNPTRGAEKQKMRPCLIIQKKITALDLITVLPITDDNGRKMAPFFVRIMNLDKAGLSKKSVIDCYQIRTVSLEQFLKKSGRIELSELNQVKSSLALILEIHSFHIQT